MPSASGTSTEERKTQTSSQPQSLWRNRDYLLLWSGQALSDIGGALSDLAYPLLALAITQSAAQAGLVAALSALPATLFNLIAGVLVDRWNRRWVMIACDIGRAVCLASIPLAYILGGLTIWQLYITAFLAGTFQVLFNLAKQAALSQVVHPAQLPAAFAREEFVEGTTSLGGPSLSGVLYTLNAALPFLADAVSYTISIVTLALIRTPFQQNYPPARRSAFRAEIAEGVRWIGHQPFILTMTLLMGSGAFVISSEGLIIIILAEQQHASAAVIGVIIAMFGIGAIVGSALNVRLRRLLSVGQSILLTRWFIALTWPLFALAPFPVTLGAIEFAGGVVEPIEDVAYFSHRLALIPDELRGRVLSVCRLLPGTMRPLGLFIVGVLIQRVGIFPTIWLQSAWLLVTTAIVTIVPTVRRERAHEQH